MYLTQSKTKKTTNPNNGMKIYRSEINSVQSIYKPRYKRHVKVDDISKFIINERLKWWRYLGRRNQDGLVKNRDDS